MKQSKQFTSIQQRVLETAQYFVENNSTVRATAQHFGYSRTLVHHDLRKRLPHIDYALYQQVAKILERNLEEAHLRGAQATIRKYAKIRSQKS